MFGAPPVGHVMDPQFKPLFLGGYGNMYANAVCSINPIGSLAKGYIPHMYVRTIMNFGGAIVFPLLVPLWKT